MSKVKRIEAGVKHSQYTQEIINLLIKVRLKWSLCYREHDLDEE